MRLSAQDTYNLARDAGFTPDQCANALGTIKAESGFDVYAIGLNKGANATVDRGLVQINDYWHPETSNEQAFTPALALREMFRISSGGTDFSPWYGWTQGGGPRYAAEFRADLGSFENSYMAPKELPDYREVAAAAASAVHDLRNGFPVSSLIEGDKSAIRALAELLD